MLLRDYIAKRPLFDADWVSVSKTRDGFDSWRLVVCHAMSGEENGGNHHIYIDVIDENGVMIQNPKDLWVTFLWGSVQVEKAVFEKPAPEPGTNIPMWPGQNITCAISNADRAYNVSDVVSGLTSFVGNPSPDGLNRPGHYSYYLVFQWTKANVVAPVTPLTMEQRMARVEAKLGF